MKIIVTNSSDQRGRHGAHVLLTTSDGGFDGHYPFTTHGMTTEEIVAKRNAIVAYHAKKVARLRGMAALYRRTIRSGYRISDCTIRERRGGVEHVLNVKTPDGETLQLGKVYNDISAVPTDNEIVQIARDAAVAHANRQKVAEDHVRSVKQVLGL